MNWILLRKPLLLGVGMLAAACVTIAATPTKKLADLGPKVDLETMIPKSFGDWRVDTSVLPLTVSPDVQEKLDKIYNQTLARTYVNRAGQRVMLSIAYGGDQSDAMRAHRPEVCYAAQGFNVSEMVKGAMSFAGDQIPVMRLVAESGARREPITYWLVVGDQVARTGFEQKIAQLRFGFRGIVPDGLLVRVSSLGSEKTEAYSLHDEFVRRLVDALPGPPRTRLLGSLGKR